MCNVIVICLFVCSCHVESSSIIRNSQSSGPRTSFYSKNPIITVTEHTPVPSPEYMRRQGSYDSQLEIISQTGSQVGFRSHMLRSHTDSHIDYSGADESGNNLYKKTVLYMLGHSIDFSR